MTSLYYSQLLFNQKSKIDDFFLPQNTETYDQIFERVLTIKCENMYNIVSIFVYMTNIANKYDFYCHMTRRTVG